jgi:4-amino-4-deoxy-L-arabinose transferase-like glycosyltransferase
VCDPEAQRPAASRLWPALAVAALTVLGSAVRIAVAGQSVFADELSTYWIVSTNGLGGVVSTVHGDAEITPPLYFVAAWVTTQIDLTPQLLRAPSLVAGIAAIPLTYLVGLRTVGRAAALVAATLTALSPFMIYYSAEARGYAMAIALVLLSTLALLAALQDGGLRWWIVYGASTWSAMLSHYTAVFALAAQLLWVVWAHSEARRPALIANGAALLAFLPWSTGLVNDLRSPTTEILGALSAFDLEAIRVALGHWAIGYPYSSPYAPETALRHMPGIPALVLLAVGLALAGVGIAMRRSPRSSRRRLDRRVVLVFALALATPVGAALVSAVGTNLFGTRNLAVSWPGLALSLSAVLVAAGPRLRVAATVLVVASFAIGGAKMLQSDYERPDYRAMARFLDSNALPDDVVVDAASVLVTPGPFTGLDVAVEKSHRVFRVGVPQQRDHPFNNDDPIPSVPEVVRRAAATAAGRRIYVVASDSPFLAPLAERVVERLPHGYRRIETRGYRGAVISVYEDHASTRG